MTHSEVEEVSGYIGNFTAKIRKKARYVDYDLCNACGECVKVCPVVKPDEFQTGLSSRKAIYIPFPQAVPCSYILNMDDCLGNNPIACGKCADVCEKKAINFDDQDEIVTREIGAVVVAIGLDVYDPTEMDEYGYTRFDNVITSMEFERLICAAGPTAGHFVRPSDTKRPKRIGFIQCVGSRNPKIGRPYCSNICCMNTVKDTLLLADHYPDTENYVFYQDIRAFGKSFEDMFQRSKEAGTRYIRGLPGDIEEDPETRNLTITVENTTRGKLERHELDMVVLSVGVQPPKDIDKICRNAHACPGPPTASSWSRIPSSSRWTHPRAASSSPDSARARRTSRTPSARPGAAASRAGALLNAGRDHHRGHHQRHRRGNLHEVRSLRPGLSRTARSRGPRGRSPASSRRRAPAAALAAPRASSAPSRCGTSPTINSSPRSVPSWPRNPQDKVFAFACNWCSYAGGDMAGISRIVYPATNRVVRTMCSARVSEEMVLEAFRCGAPVVLVSGCHYADCHYINANRQTVVRVQNLWNKLEKAGVRPERLQLEWISAAEGQKFARVMSRMEELRTTVTMEEIEHAREALKPKPKKATCERRRPRHPRSRPRTGRRLSYDGTSPSKRSAA